MRISYVLHERRNKPDKTYSIRHRGGKKEDGLTRKEYLLRLRSTILIFASPTYKAAYTGLLKAFLDRYQNNGLAGVTAVPVMTGGWPGHLLAVEVHLRPVLIELGATVPARGLYVTEPELADLDTAVGKWSATAAPLIKTSTQK